MQNTDSHHKRQRTMASLTSPTSQAEDENKAGGDDPAPFARCPPTVRSFIDTCLQPRADDRTHSVDDLLQHPWIQKCPAKEIMQGHLVRQHLRRRKRG